MSAPRFRSHDNIVGAILGPLRVFAEHNAQTYWGVENTWRPDDQTRIGFDYWKAMHVNRLTRAWWLEVTMRVARYYHAAAPGSVPRTDVRVGLSASIGDWYK